MDYRGLYKASRGNVLNSTAKTKRNLKVNKERSTKRNNLFLNGRDMKDCSVHENENVQVNKSHIAKLSKQEAYTARFYAWKAEREKRRNEEAKKQKPKPFISTVKAASEMPHYKFDPPKSAKKTTKENTIWDEKSIKSLTTSRNGKSESEQKCFRKPLAPLKNGKVPALESKAQRIVNSKSKKEIQKTSVKTNSNKINTVKEKSSAKTLKKPKFNLEETLTPLKIEAEKQDTDFSNCLTSTGVKPSQNLNLLCKEYFGDPVSPIDVNVPLEIAPNNVKSEKKQRLSKINCFEPNSENTSLEKKALKIIQCEHVTSTSPDISPKAEENAVDLNCTPTNANDNEPSNYMSPFVTISRGKVSAKIERVKRESIYKLEESSPGDPIEVRRTRESVKYFRKLLNDEILRLHNQCYYWEDYKLKNKHNIEEVAIDMINTTVGQTRLLTSKKLEQFRGLIDRCEQGLVKSEPENNEQIILREDLEGFWSMVQLQVENVDKRFANLKRWKDSDWIDPDEEKPKQKTKLRSKVTKTKKAKPIKPNEHLMGLLKKAQAAYKNSKGPNNAQENDVIFVAPKRTNRRSSNTPVRVATKCIEDKHINSDHKDSSKKLRKSSSSSSSRYSTPRRSTPQKSTKRTSTPRRSEIKAKRSLLANTLNKVHENRLNNSPRIVQRKSILRTPGTAKKQKQKVIFNEELDFNSPEYLTGIDVLSDDDSVFHRSMHLRSRKVILRPDYEIEIP